MPPDADAPCVLAVFADGSVRAEIEDHKGEVIAYRVAPHDEGGLALARLDGKESPYHVRRRMGVGLLLCDCPDRWRARREARQCKHRVWAQRLAALRPLIEALEPHPETIPMPPRNKPDEPSPPRTPDQPAPGPAPAEAAQAPQALAAAVAKALAEPFAPDRIGWKPQSVSGNRALAVAYIDARDVMDRLDAVVGVAGWQDSYHENADGTVCCTLELRLGGEWLAKADVGAESEQKDPGDRKKAAYSDALKRAAVKWGVGRYLYSLPTVWADYDPQKKQFARPPQLPAWALPPGHAPAEQPKPQRKVHESVRDTEDWMIRRELIAPRKTDARGDEQPGELTLHLIDVLGPRIGYDPRFWGESERPKVEEAVRAFVAKKQQAKAG